ncbi:hypothetical protein M407DRAFT_28770 [Tulasnella calospora MUT 4182]|uniref:Protein kinase domain-containing protein n=1 Tax=Tulasnella calospora MUT 4182 TaxID=1051891 RepID=A0A0C3LJP9_9AGAM|nr:hypothetical protein M407DRAFT_28770 [Tulasnella calospora MUT 4182]
MAHDTRPGSNENEARGILNRIAHCRIDPSRIKMADTIHDGGDTKVIVGTLIPPDTWTVWPPELKVAVKKLELSRNNIAATEEFLYFIHELGLLETLSHPNVIRLVGFVDDEEKGQVWLITPSEANGNVREFLKSGEWDLPERVSLIKDVVSGLEYLHTREPPICHGDLKPPKIIVNSSYRAVISDFESARVKKKGEAAKEEGQPGSPRLTGIKDDGWTSLIARLDLKRENFTVAEYGWTFRWAAPELFGGALQDLPSDMWAIGWICWEIVTGKIPHEGFSESAMIQRVIKRALPTIRDDAKLSHVLQLWSLIQDCWLSNPADRIDISTFCRKVRFIPSATPSCDTSGGQKVRPAALLLKLGRIHDLQNDTAQAESYFRSALDVAIQTKDDNAEANALIRLGEVYNTLSRYPEAEKAFREASEIHSHIGNDFGVANASIGLGVIYNAQLKYSEAEKTFRKAQKIHSRIRNDLGAMGALVDLGDIHDARSRSTEVETAFREAREIFSRTGDNSGATNALISPGDFHDARSKYSEAEKAFREAHQILSGRRGLRDLQQVSWMARWEERIATLIQAMGRRGTKGSPLHDMGNDPSAENVTIGHGEVYDARWRYQEAEIAYREAYQIHSRIHDGLDLGAANALIGLGDIYNAQSKFSEAEKAFREAYEIQSRIGNDLGTANAQIGLGNIYNTRSRYSEAERAFSESHKIYSRIGNNFGAGNALIGLGGIYSARWRYQDAEKAFREAHEIHSRIGNVIGAANAQIGLGRIYSAFLRYSEAKQTFDKAYQIHFRIGNDLGTANALIGLGEIYNARWRYQDAEKAFREAHEIHSRIGHDLGVANALIGLGDIYAAQSKYSKAEQVFREALEIHSRIGNDLGAANALIGLGDIYNAHSRYTEAESAFVEARKIYSRIGNEVRAASAGIHLGETYSTQFKYPEADDALKETLGIVSSVEKLLSTQSVSNDPVEDCDTQSSHSEDEEAKGKQSRIGHDAKMANAQEDLRPTHLPSSTDSDAHTGLENAQDLNYGIGMGTEIVYPENNLDQWSDSEAGYRSPGERLPVASPSPCTALSPTSLAETSDSLHLPGQRMSDDSASSQIASVADTPPKRSRQEQNLSEELTAIARAPAPVTEELVDLLQALGKAAPKAVRNKHKIYSILRVSRDICNRLTEIENPPEHQSDSNIKTLITRAEDYCALLDGLEETLLQLAAILPFEVTAFGADLYSSWSSSRFRLTGILNDLCRPPFSTISSHAQDMADDLLFDDCSWLSRLLYSGIHPEIATQFLDVPPTHPVFAVANGLEYLENQVKCGVPNEPTRGLIIDIATLLAQTLASTSPDDDDDKSLQEKSSLPAEADRDWLIQALAE